MSEKLDRLRATRGGNRGVITKYTKEVIELLKGEPINKDRLRTVNDLLNEKLAVVKKTDEEILEVCDTKDIEHEIEEAEEIYSRVLDVKQAISKAEHSEQSLGATALHVNNTEKTEETETVNNNNNNHQTKTKLPRLNLQKFEGNSTKWDSFWDSFKSVIHDNAAISTIDKFNYLHSYLEGAASRAIQGLTFTESNYNAAVDILKERFGKTQLIISGHMDELLKLPNCPNDRASSLRYLYDKVSVHVRGLDSLGVSPDHYGSLLIPIIMGKLPAEIRLEAATKTSGEIWKIDELLNTLKKEREAREASDGNLVHSGVSGKQQRGVGRSRINSTFLDA